MRAAGGAGGVQHLPMVEWLLAQSEAAGFVTSEVASTSAPRWRAAIVSSAVDMPTRSAPAVRSITISAGVS